MGRHRAMAAVAAEVAAVEAAAEAAANGPWDASDAEAVHQCRRAADEACKPLGSMELAVPRDAPYARCAHTGGKRLPQGVWHHPRSLIAT